MGVPDAAPSNAPSEAAVPTEPRSSRRAIAWRRQLPYVGALILTLIGVAYTGHSKRPIVDYWELLTIVMAALCVSTGWRQVHDKEGRLRLVWTQALHWLAFLVAMNLVLLTSMQSMLNADATGLAILMLLALGTFVAGALGQSHLLLLRDIGASFCPARSTVEPMRLVARRPRSDVCVPLQPCWGESLVWVRGGPRGAVR